VGTVFGVFVIPVLFIIFQTLQEKIVRKPEALQEKHGEVT
jgi:HAE1 family hydrophobic/amphiphilic exporter-1